MYWKEFGIINHWITRNEDMQREQYRAAKCRLIKSGPRERHGELTTVRSRRSICL